MNLQTVVAFTLLSAFVPGAALATPVYDLWNRDSDSHFVGLEGWGLKIERLFGEGARYFNFNNPGGAHLYVTPGNGQAQLLAELTGSGSGAAGPYTLNLMFSGMTVGAGPSGSLAAGFSSGGPVVLGTLTTPEGTVYHVVTGAGPGASLTLSNGADGSGLEANGSLRFCADASCETLAGDAVGTLTLGAGCAQGSDCSGLPQGGRQGGRSFTVGGSQGAVQILQLALPPEGFDETQVVPEPATYCMLGFGLIALALKGRRKE